MTKLKQLGQGMTEYIIIVALIAIAAITIYGLFGDTIRGQMGAMTQELAGQEGATTVSGAVQSAGSEAGTEAGKQKGLDTYAE